MPIGTRRPFLSKMFNAPMAQAVCQSGNLQWYKPLLVHDVSPVALCVEVERVNVLLYFKDFAAVRHARNLGRTVRRIVANERVRRVDHNLG